MASCLAPPTVGPGHPATNHQGTTEKVPPARLLLFTQRMESKETIALILAGVVLAIAFIPVVLLMALLIEMF